MAKLKIVVSNQGEVAVWALDGTYAGGVQRIRKIAAALNQAGAQIIKDPQIESHRESPELVRLHQICHLHESC